MHIIRTPENFRHLAQKVHLYGKDLIAVKTGLWMLPFQSRSELLSAELIELVKAYNTDEDKQKYIAQQSRNKGNHIRFDNRLGVIYLEGSLDPKDGHISVTIVVPKPLQPTNDNTPTAVNHMPGYQVEICKQAGKPFVESLQVGDILQLDEDESVKTISDGIALVIIRYQVQMLEQVVKSHDGGKLGGSESEA